MLSLKQSLTSTWKEWEAVCKCGYKDVFSYYSKEVCPCCKAPLTAYWMLIQRPATNYRIRYHTTGKL